MSDSTITWDEIKNNPEAIKVLDHGFVLLKSVYGQDCTIAEAARNSYGKGTKTPSDDRGLIRYLFRHKHTSPVEQCCASFLIKLPLFVMAQLVRHRTAKLNQLSGRYSEMPSEYYLPENIAWRKQSTTNKQGGEEQMTYLGRHFDLNESRQIVEQCAQAEYQERLKNGVSRELARTCLPQSQYTVCVWQMDLHNLTHFLQLRLDSHAQYEIRVYAQAIYDLLKPKFPVVMEAFEDYKLHAKTFSRMELTVLKKMLKSNWFTYQVQHDAEESGMSKREIEEFVQKLS